MFIEKENEQEDNIKDKNSYEEKDIEDDYENEEKKIEKEKDEQHEEQKSILNSNERQNNQDLRFETKFESKKSLEAGIVKDFENPVPKDNKSKDKDIDIKKNKMLNLASNQTDQIKFYKHIESILTVIYSILFIIIVFTQFNVGNRFKVYNSLREYLEFPTTGELDFFKEEVPIFIEKLVSKFMYEKLWIWDKKYQLISSFRFTSRLSRLMSSVDQTPFNNLNSSYFATIKITIDDEFNKKLEENQDYNGFSFSKENSYLQKGGYVFNINRTIFQITNQTEYEETVNKLKSRFHDFIYDSRVRTVVMDFIVANNELNYIMPVVISFDFSPTGFITSKFNMFITQGGLYDSAGSFVRAALEILSFLISVFFLIFVIIKMIKHVNSTHERLTKIYLENFSNYNSQNSFYKKGKNVAKIPNKFLIFLDYIKQNMLLIIQVISLILSIVSMLFWGFYVFKLLKYFQEFEIIFSENSEYVIDYQLENDIITSCQSLEIYRSTVTINFLFLLFRNIEVLSIYFPSTNIFLNTISQALGDLLSFFVFFIILLLGFSIFTFFFYGRFLSNFNNFFFSLQQNLSFTMGSIDFETFNLMNKYDQSITLIYFLLVVYFLKYIVTKILLAIILYYFKISLDKFEGKEIEAKQNQIYTKEKIGRSSIVNLFHYFKVFFVKLWGIFYFCNRNKKSKIQNFNHSNKKHSIEIKVDDVNIKKGMEEGNSVNEKINNNVQKNSDSNSKNQNFNQIKDIKQFNIEYSDDYYFYLRKPYFDSQNDEAKQKQYYEIRYQKIYLNCIVFIIFIISLIISVLLQTNTPWRGGLINAISTLVNSPLMNTQELKYGFMNLNDQDNVETFVFDLLPSYFQNSVKSEDTGNLYQILQESNGIESSSNNQSPSSSYFLLRLNELIRNKILLTVKKINSKNQDGFSRYYESLSINSKNMNETKTDVKIDDMVIKYKYEESYRNLGGYTAEIDLAKYSIDKETYIKPALKDFLIDPLSTFIIIEFILYNVEYKLMAYVEMKIKNDYGTFYQNELNTYIFKRYFANFYMDYIQYGFEIIFVILLIYQIVTFISDTIKQFKSYNKWYLQHIKKLSFKTQDLRNYHAPEILRKFKYLLSFNRIYEFSILALSATLIFLRIFTIINDIEVNRNLTSSNGKSIYEIRRLVYNSVDSNYSFQMIGVITIFLSSLRFIVLLRLGKYFFILIKTIDNSKSNYIKFFIIFVFVHFAFILFSHICFGITERRYYLLQNTIMFSINMIFGNLDWKIYNSANSIFGPIFFFLFIFIINMILLNLFFAIIDSSYIKVKEEIKKTIEKWSFIRVVFSCCFKLFGKKKIFVVTNEHKGIETEFQSGKLITFNNIKMDIHINRYKFEEWMEEEMENLIELNKKMYENKQKLIKIENCYNSSVAGEFNIFENDAYKNVKEVHFSCYNLSYIGKLISICERLEEDVIKIEEYNEHLIGYEESSDLIAETNKLKDKNISIYPESLSIKERIANNLWKIEQMKKDLEDLNDLNEI